MPTIFENRHLWTTYNWSRKGEEWGSGKSRWCANILPRIVSFLPVQHILEIAPGYGRITQFLKDQCRQLTVIDIAENCTAACRERFKECSHIRYFIGDGKSVPMIEAGSIDFVFSWDSLVHAELDAMEGYIGELPRVLKPDGLAFLHHSNYGEYVVTGEAERFPNRGMRGTTVSASIVRRCCERAGLACILQERVVWSIKDCFTDCFSLITQSQSKWKREFKCLDNSEFGDEVTAYNQIAQHWE